MALSTASPMTFVATADAAAARAFYEGVLGLRCLADAPFALVFELAGGVPLHIQKAGPFTPHPFTALGWAVDDLAATVDALTARGVTFARWGHFEQDARGIWSAPGGARVAWFRDPDGNLLSLTQERADP